MYPEKGKRSISSITKENTRYDDRKIYMYKIIHCVADKCTSALHKALTLITGGKHF